MSIPWLPVALLLAVTLTACNRSAPGNAPLAATVTGAEQSGALVHDSVPPPAPTIEEPRETDWRPMQLTAGKAWISCESDYAQLGDGQRLMNLGFSAIWQTMAACRERSVMRLRYRGKINVEFTALVERTAEVAGNLGIAQRILDVDSTGGMIEDGIRAGDSMAEADWTIWVREGASCHSACVLVLAAGDMRLIAGDIGIHRMIRVGSAATSRRELNKELQEVYTQMQLYLERNGAAVAIADLMMTVPNRSLRLLSDAELDLYGLNGLNAAEDDLNRIRLTRKCGAAFVQRRDNFFRTFDNQCSGTDGSVDNMKACGQSLKKRFGFPDADCPEDGPLAEYDHNELSGTS
ncbi:MAG: hypothetical protein M3374_06815 [Pseudomonadota bacterium]|nr:hypothetical protein [Pseudomonadota bacterium]